MKCVNRVYMSGSLIALTLQRILLACLLAINSIIFQEACWADTDNAECPSVMFVSGNEYKDQSTLNRMHHAYIDKQRKIIKNNKRLLTLIKESPKDGMYIGAPNERLSNNFVLFVPSTKYCGTAGCTVYFFSKVDDSIVDFCDPVQVSGSICMKIKSPSNMPEFILNNGLSVKYNGKNYCRSPVLHTEP